MPRRKAAERRKILPDPKYNDRLVAKFMHSLMYQGLMSKAERICYRALDIVGEKTGDDPLKVFKKAITIEKEVGRKDIMAQLFLNFGDLYMADENLKQAEKFFW